MPHEPVKRPVITVGEAAEILHVDPDTIKRYLARHQLEGYRLPGGHFRIYEDSVARITENGR